MGFKYEVSVWSKRDGYGYAYIQQYAGDSLTIALLTMFKLKRRGHHYVKLEWSGDEQEQGRETTEETSEVEQGQSSEVNV